MSKPISYKNSGVNIDAGNELIKRIKPLAQSTLRPEVLTGLGGFGGLYALPTHYKEPILVSTTDGVGTKLKLALDCQQLGGIGIDLVAMCVNDLIVAGAEPLFFLDYFATSELNLDQAQTVISSITAGCQQAGCALVGGETAEMPGFYQPQEFDLAGFSVGIVEKAELINGETITPNDSIIAIASSGPHSNGYSFIRKVLTTHHISPNELLEGKPLTTHLLEPTKIYVKPLLSLLKEHSIKGIAHITGGGLTENLPRILPEGLCAQVDTQTWQWPTVFHWLQEKSEASNQEMYRTFNCGVGMIIVAPKPIENDILQDLEQQGLNAWTLGKISPLTHDQDLVSYAVT